MPNSFEEEKYSLSNVSLIPVLTRIAEALERLSPPKTDLASTLTNGHYFIWDNRAQNLLPVSAPKLLELSILQGIDTAKDTLLNNTRYFAKGLPANNALLWGARGTGKSSLIKAVHHYITLSG